MDVAYESMDSNFSKLNDLKFLAPYYERRLSQHVDVAAGIIERYQRQVQTGKISLATAKSKAIGEIREIRFDNGTGYIWINDTTYPYPTMVMHPTVPSLDGKVLDDPTYDNASGKDQNLFQAMVEVTKREPQGFVDYLWPKPTADGVTTERVQKLSYVRRVNDWDWILGTGIYIDDARLEIENQVKDTIRAMRYDNGVGYFWINDNTLPYPTMVMHPTVPALDGQVLDDPKFNNAQGVDKNLFQAFAEVAAERGEGFVDYLWPKPTADGLTARAPKISYVRLHAPTGWIIGSGAYIDGIEAAVAAQQGLIEAQIPGTIRKNLMATGVFIVLAMVAAYFFAARCRNPSASSPRSQSVSARARISIWPSRSPIAWTSWGSWPAPSTN